MDETEQISEEERAVLSYAESRATPGPWRNGADPSHFGAPEVTDDKTFAYWITKDADALFVALARTAVPKLLAEVARLRRVAGNLHAELQTALDENESLRDAAHRSRSDLLRLETEFDQQCRDLNLANTIVGADEHAMQSAVDGLREQLAVITRERDATREDVDWYKATTRAFMESQERLAAEVAAVTRERDVTRVDLAQMTDIADALRASRDEAIRDAVDDAIRARDDDYL